VRAAGASPRGSRAPQAAAFPPALTHLLLNSQQIGSAGQMQRVLLVSQRVRGNSPGRCTESSVHQLIEDALPEVCFIDEAPSSMREGEGVLRAEVEPGHGQGFAQVQ